jgi:glutamate dehydrogenase
VLESLGVTVIDEVPYRLLGGEELHLHDVGVRLPAGAVRPVTDRAVRDAASAAIRAAWRGHAEIDPLTRLVLLTELSWRDIGILRAYRRYRRQLGTPYTPAYVEETLVEHATATAALLGRFRARFDPGVDDDQRGAEQHRADDAFEVAMADVTRLDADRILRGLSALVDATVRTNAFRHDAVADGSGEPYIALKFDPSRIPDLAPPVLHREVFVHSPRVEGVHLRAGAVARGGLRWSDRRDDVRTEVMGLVKAQVLKNALIVPTGAKGGFVLSRRPEDPQALRDEVERQYVTFIRGLLDVTDGLGRDDAGDDAVLPPPGVVRHDGDDSYLVVAADKGTATFSDTANAISERYGFWLGDAFASGGSRGYDHKALGVTAKGAWRAVARHFHELGVDVATETITVAGVGDMSGDVFSNGVQRSDALQLVAAFDHRHIFVDPDPDPARSFAERQRLADLGRSSWDDYDRDVLSPGGFIVPRDVRSVTLTAEARRRLRLDVDELSPPALIRAILGAPVDLLWAGGVGTYIRASEERDEDVGDRANDEVRVAASEVRARVLGEGANLFLTQRARIELARRGARVDQDSLHNAAGVATSDAEVNLKILLDLAIADGRLAADARDRVLTDLADDVVDAVLGAVDRQVAAVSAEVAREVSSQAYEEFLARLEDQGELDREVEVLPSSEELSSRAAAGGGLTRPELTTLLAWSKRELKEALLASDAPEGPVLAAAVTEPFPARAVERFGDLLPHHRLHRELVATAVANDTVDHLGITVASSLAAETGVGLPAVARAVRVATRMVDAHRWWVEVDRLAEVHGPVRVRELASVVDGLVVDLTTTLLGDPMLDHDPLGLLERDAEVAEQLLANGFHVGSTTQRRARVAHARWLLDDLVEPDLARLLACAGDLAATPDVSRIVAELDGAWSPVEVADVTFRLAETLGIDQLRSALDRVPPGESWSRRQRLGVARDLRLVRRDAASGALKGAKPETPATEVVEAAVAENRQAVDRARRVVADASATSGDLHAISVAVRELRDAVGPASTAG